MNQKGHVLLVVLLIAVAIGGYLLYTNYSNNRSKVTTSVVQQTTQPSPSPSDETANWKTYTNTKYGFSFKYPSNLVVAEQDTIQLTNEASMPQVIPNKYINILIFVYSIDPQTSLRGWVEKDTIRNKPDGTTGSTVIGTIDNYQSGDLQGFTYHGGAEVDVKHVLFKKEGKIFDFTLDCYETGCSYKDNPEAEAVFNQILSTFKFTN